MNDKQSPTLHLKAMPEYSFLEREFKIYLSCSIFSFQGDEHSLGTFFGYLKFKYWFRKSHFEEKFTLRFCFARASSRDASNLLLPIFHQDYRIRCGLLMYSKSLNADGSFCFVPSINITLILHCASVSDSRMKDAVYHIECCKTPHKGNYLADCFSLDILIPFLDDMLTLLNQDGEKFSHIDPILTRLRTWSCCVVWNVYMGPELVLSI